MIRSALLILATITLVHAATSGGDERTTASIYANPLPEQELVEVFLQFDNAEGWHLYWSNPGDSGLAPSVTWTTPEGWESVGDLQFPPPKRKETFGIVTYELGGSFTVRQLFKVPGKTAGAVKADLKWLACAEACIPGKTSVETPVDPSKAASDEIIAMAKTASDTFPTPAPTDALTVTTKDGWIEIRLSEGHTPTAFFPAKGQPIAHDVAQEIGKDSRLRIKLKDGAEIPKAIQGVITLKPQDNQPHALTIDQSLIR